MIPTLLLVGFVLGRWWRFVIPLASIGWALLLVSMGIGSGLAFIASAALIGLANIAVGVLLFQAIRLVLHRVIPRPSA